MIFINCRKFKQLEYDIAKIIFMNSYKNIYTLVYDYKGDENYFFVRKQNENSIFMILLFDRPDDNLIEKNKDKKIIVYQKRRTIPKNSLYLTIPLTKSFCNEYDYVLNNLFDNNEILREYEYCDFFLKKYYFDLNDSEIFKHIDHEYCYKYYKDDKYLGDLGPIQARQIALVNPNQFNDPFDCDCEVNDENKKNDFRVLCVTSDYKNILMWSYYANNHEGYCKRYSISTIIDEISMLKNTTGICFYGKINYLEKRPNYKLKRKAISTFLERQHYINCLFTKFKKWEYEKEERFVVINNNQMRDDKIIIDGNANKVYIGCKNNIGHGIHLYKDQTEFKLRER